MGRAQVILVDTHIVVWLAFAPDKLSRKARAAIDGARTRGEGVAISDITLLELARLATDGRIKLTISVEAFLSEVEARFVVLPITARACVRAMALASPYPKDPADRIIAGTALAEGRSLVTADRHIISSRALATIW
jgi:PIN domain nuclease of toxin-antitoxin system